ncbi:MAG: hypothetical protein RLZZ40_970 [Actinomycetota bacterium]
MRKWGMVLVALLLAGCTNLPTSGPVQVGGPLDTVDDTLVQYLPAGPAAGATQQEIIDGFIAAGAAAQDDYRVARSFLTDDFAAAWNPQQESVVRGQTSSISVVGNATARFTTDVSARITGGGFYSVEESGTSQSFEFGMEQVNGEWRISSAPDAVFVSQATFASTYQAFTVYFYNATRTQYVPDVRYFPRAGDPVTDVARAVVAGPSEFLPYATTAFPDATTLVATPVDVVDGRAMVDVSADVLDSTPNDKRAMLAQLTASLDAISGVSSVSLTVDRSILAMSGGVEPNATVEPLVNDNPLAAVDGSFGYIFGSTVEPIGRLGDAIMALKPTAVSYHDTGVAAVGTSKGVYFVGDSQIRVSKTKSAVQPQIDGSNAVWWVSPGDPSVIQVHTSGQAKTFTGPWGDSGRIVSLEVSRDDARLAIGVNTASGPRLYVASIGRDGKGHLSEIGGFHRLPIQGKVLVDLAWADATNVAVISQTATVSYVELASIGGVTTTMGQPLKPVSIVGGNGRAELVVRSSDGELWQPRAGGWQAIGVTVDLLATQH